MPRIVPLLLLAACVSKGRHELVEVQLDATRTALSARQAACQEATTALEAELALRTAERDDARHASTERDEAIAALRAALEALHATEAARLAASADPTAAPPSAAELTATLLAASDARIRAQEVAASHARVVTAFRPLVDAGRVSVVEAQEGSIVRIGVDVLFQEGKVQLSPLGESVLADVARALGTVGERALRIDGHTDDATRHSVGQPSNWELGFDRAMLVLRALEELGIPMRPTAASLADTAPIADPATPDGDVRNARIELVLPAPAPRTDR